MSELLERLSDAVSGPVLVHSDVSRVMGAIKPTTDRTTLLQRHVEVLEGASADGLFFPTFNYGFPGTGIYDVEADPSEVGVLSEYARQHWAEWRTPMPIFSFVGRGEAPSGTGDVASPGTELDPFDDASLFGHLRRARGTVLMYGAPFRSFTGIHHIEAMAGRPAYRYDKWFSGRLVRAGEAAAPLRLRYHVRPLGMRLDYDWPRLREDALEGGELTVLRAPGVTVEALDFSALAGRWADRIQAEPMFLLDDASKALVGPKLAELGRRFALSDFEEAAADD